MTAIRVTAGADEYAPMDISSLLDSEEMIAEYLAAAADDDDPRVLMLAIADVAKARGMAHVAEAAGLGRESLYKTLAPGAHPRFETIVSVLRALGVKVTVRGSKSVDAAPPKRVRVLSKPIHAKLPRYAKVAASTSRKTAVKSTASRKQAAKRAPAKRGA